MSTTPSKKVERNRNNPGGRNHVRTPPANHTYDGEEVCCFVLGGGT